MSAPAADVLRWGGERAKAGRWRGDRSVAYLSPLPDAPLPSPQFVLRCLATLSERGFTRVVTGALTPLEQTAFLVAGFGEEERLHLLGLDLTGDLAPVPAGHRLVRPWGQRRRGVLEVDADAFPVFWRFDSSGLVEALAATPRTRFRAAIDPADGRVAGYAISGRAGRRGFVQRLAVDPRRQRVGTGRRLVLDGLHWMRRRGAHRAVVNTQIGNERALALYRSIGFRQEPAGLSVLSVELR